MKKIAKILLIIFAILTVALGIIYYNAVNYNTYSIKADKSKFEAMSSKEDFNNLAKDLVAQMSLEEKIDQMYGETMRSSLPKFIINALIKQRFAHVYVGKNERLNIPPWVLSDGPRGARVMDKDVNAVTTFPVAMARGASWDTELESRVNDVIAIEMRANGTNYAATPCVNLLRHPGWGRAQETYGEDPWLLGQMGVAAVKAIQNHDVMACPKHFALNSIENSRFVVNVDVDDRTLREVYLPHFKKIVQEGETASLMSAYNFVRGEQCGANKELLTDILRDEWGFEGFVSTDWVFGIYDGIGAVKAGLDVEMPWQDDYSYENIKEGINSGAITEEEINIIVRRTLSTRLEYAFAEDKMDYSKDQIAKQEHIDLTREVAEKSMVLLKNQDILPFKKSKNKKIAVIGRLADLPNTGDQGSSNSTAPYVITPYAGIKSMQEALGNEVTLNDGSNIEQAKQLAKDADEVIIIVGYTHEDEGEYIIMSRDKMETSAKAKKLVGEKGMGGDRTSLKLLPMDETLIKALAPLNTNTVVSYIGGSAIDMSNWEDEVPAILFSWYAGMEGGNALANILYGNVNPSGKLPFSIAKNENDYPFFNPYIDNITYEYYHGYTLFEKKSKPISYPFGFGLSYTDFEYSNLVIENSELHNTDTISVKVDLKNIGSLAGEEAVQLYVGFKNSQVDRPIKLLRGFDKVHLNPDELKTVDFALPVQEISFYNPQSSQWEIEKMEYEIYLGSSSRNEDLLMGTFAVN